MSARSRLRSLARSSGLLVGVTWVGPAACTSEVTHPEVPTTVSLSATPSSVTVGEGVTFRFEARATELEGLILNYGDGTEDSIATFLAQTASGNLNHVYGAAGSYRAAITAFARGGKTAVDTVRIAVTPSGRPAGAPWPPGPGQPGPGVVNPAARPGAG